MMTTRPPSGQKEAQKHRHCYGSDNKNNNDIGTIFIWYFKSDHYVIVVIQYYATQLSFFPIRIIDSFNKCLQALKYYGY